ncbi:hypothetical protein BGZ65_012275 [Modicella reniformis]|uniref:Piwi domain-containing protein n=1 Tax=Modicella reniformis TaxID=1440133 RepID=A0A9P6II84_9FUNG|nr:hypothetical protein BGZ65_012275 [Modicella reniformis]
MQSWFASRTEIVAKLSTATTELLKTFYQIYGQKSERIVVVNSDGVSEGQSADVQEVTAVKAGCRTLEANYQPDHQDSCPQQLVLTRLSLVFVT